jgi:ActR/RegA family two-component response regulator
MPVKPSCPILLVHPDDAFRRNLIAELDQRHFTVTFSSTEAEALTALQARPFRVIVLWIDHGNGHKQLVDYVRDHRTDLAASILVLGEPNPDLRTIARFADETLLKPVDPVYVAERARVYC